MKCDIQGIWKPGELVRERILKPGLFKCESGYGSGCRLLRQMGQFNKTSKIPELTSFPSENALFQHPKFLKVTDSSQVLWQRDNHRSRRSEN